MSSQAQRPPAGEPWIWLTRELLASDAWRSLGINGRRFVDFLLLDYMRGAGRQNGELKATRRQLWDFGIGQHQVSAAICEAEDRGLVDCHRAGMRVATTYTLTWLPHHDGTAASNRWRSYRMVRKFGNLSVKQHSALSVKQHSDGPNLSVKQHSDASGNLSVKQHSLLEEVLSVCPQTC
jgi:hypothetical protein